jgi:hypothetical protein
MPCSGQRADFAQKFFRVRPPQLRAIHVCEQAVTVLFEGFELDELCT